MSEAARLTDATAASLGVETGGSALRVLRHCVDDAGETIEISTTVNPVGRFTLSGILKREIS